MKVFIEVLHALTYTASIIRAVLYVYEWWKKHKQTDSEGR